jgi:hypothetical protein
MKRVYTIPFKDLSLSLIALLWAFTGFSQTWHSQKDYQNQYEDHGAQATIGNVGIGFWNAEDLNHPSPNIDVYPMTPYLPQKPLHILGYESEESSFIAPVPGIRLDHRTVSESSGGTGNSNSNSRVGGPEPSFYSSEMVSEQHVWDLENNKGELRFLKDGNVRFQYNKDRAQFGIPLAGAEYDLNIYGTVRIGLNSTSSPNNLIVTGLSTFQGDLNAERQAFFQDKVVIGNPEFVHSNQTSSMSKLIVQGTAIFQEVLVDHVNAWNDKVFEEDYELVSLDEIEKYINIHKHLPEIPDEKSVTQNGYNLTEMDALLLKKIEEMTLYLIELKKENEEMKLLIAKK